MNLSGLHRIGGKGIRNHGIHQQKIFLSGWNGSVSVDALCQSRQRHPSGGLFRTWHQYHASRCILPTTRRFTSSYRSVSLLFQTNTLAFWATVTICQNGLIGTCLQRDCNAMGDFAKISPHVPSTCVHNAILSLLIIRIIPSHQIYVAIDNPSLLSSISYLTTSSYLWNDVRVDDDVSHAENLESDSCWCVSHLYKFRDGIQVT